MPGVWYLLILLTENRGIGAKAHYQPRSHLLERKPNEITFVRQEIFENLIWGRDIFPVSQCDVGRLAAWV